MAKKWTRFPHPDKAYAYDGAALKKNWARLHRGDCEPFRKDAAVQRRVAALPRRRIPAGGRSRTARPAARASMRRSRRKRSTPTISETDKAQLALFEEAAAWADARRAEAPKDANAHYLYAYALGRYGQGISVAKALAQGFGGKIKDALGQALKLAPSTPMRTPRSARTRPR